MKIKSISVLFFGVCLGFGIAQFTPQSKAASDVKIVGESGDLLGYDVISDGQTLCSDPFVSVTLQTIECE